MPEVAISRQNQTNTTALGGNIPYAGLAWRASHKPEGHVYIYNVSRRTFPQLGRLLRPVPGVIDTDPVVEGMAKNEQYHLVTSFPHPIIITRENNDSNQFDPIETDGVRYVVDLINPDNLTRTLDVVIPQAQRFSAGNDLSQKGVFFSESNPPKAEEVRKAIDRMEGYYKALLEKADTLELTDKAQLAQELGNNPDYAFAAEYYGKSVSWRKTATRPQECTNCGEQKPFGRLFHVNSQLGFVCVEPTVEGWKAVVSAGVKKYDDVPDEFRWKVDARSKIDQLAAQVSK